MLCLGCHPPQPSLDSEQYKHAFVLAKIESNYVCHPVICFVVFDIFHCYFHMLILDINFFLVWFLYKHINKNGMLSCIFEVQFFLPFLFVSLIIFSPFTSNIRLFQTVVTSCSNSFYFYLIHALCTQAVLLQIGGLFSHSKIFEIMNLFWMYWHHGDLHFRPCHSRTDLGGRGRLMVFYSAMDIYKIVISEDFSGASTLYPSVTL